MMCVSQVFMMVTNLSSGEILPVDTGGGLKLEIFHGSFHEIKERHQITSVQRIVAAGEENFSIYVGDLSSLTTKTLKTKYQIKISANQLEILISFHDNHICVCIF